MPNITISGTRALAVVGLLLTMGAANCAMYLSGDQFTVMTMTIDQARNGTLDIVYVDPGSPIIHASALQLAPDPADKNSVIIHDGSKDCGSMIMKLALDGKVLLASRAGITQPFTRLTAADREQRLETVRDTSAGQDGSKGPILHLSRPFWPRC